MQISVHGLAGVVSIHDNKVWKQLVQISVRGPAGVVSGNQVRREQTHKGVSMEITI